jgi:hypothetical protein
MNESLKISVASYTAVMLLNDKTFLDVSVVNVYWLLEMSI